MTLQTAEVQSGEFLPVLEVLQRSKTEPFAPDNLEGVEALSSSQGLIATAFIITCFIGIGPP